MSHVLIAGLGNLGQPLAQRLVDDGHQVSGIRRRHREVPGVDLYVQNLVDDHILLPPDQVDLLFIILTPGARNEGAYRDAFLTGPTRLLDALQQQQPLPPLVFVSSTAVFGNVSGEVNEESEPVPDAFNGRILLAAEQELSMRTVMSAVRFSGIYGRNSQRLRDQARAIAQGEAELPAAKWTNRIHREDCVTVLHRVGQGWLNGELMPPVIVGTDNQPASNHEVLAWLAEQEGLSLALPASVSPSGKRVLSRFVDEHGVPLRYPDFRAGYGDDTPPQ